MEITKELLAELEQKAMAAVVDNTRYGDPACYDPRIGLTNVEQAFACAATPATILALTEHIRSLTERVEKAEKDAVRYRWLRRSDEGVGDELRTALLHECGDEFLDEAIDAAIAQEGADHE